MKNKTISIKHLPKEIDPRQAREEYEAEIIRKYGKPIRKIYTDEELEPYKKLIRKPPNKEEIIRKWGKNRK